ncbi:MAG TPA: hypothetical protein VMO80_16200, partial [Terriglobales bacterium]|nr:hypothetical protein [Terriglobales bacterium]
RVGDLLQFENLRPAETSDDESFHAESLTVRWRDTFPQQEAVSRSAALASIMMIEFPIPVA